MSCCSPKVRTTRCRGWGWGERRLGLLWRVLIQVVLKWHAHLKFDFSQVLLVIIAASLPITKFTTTKKTSIMLIDLGDDDVLGDVSLLHKLSLSAGTPSSCILILSQWIAISSFHLSSHLWFANVLTAVIDGGQDDWDHWSLARLRGTAVIIVDIKNILTLELVKTVTILIMSDFEKIKMTGKLSAKIMIL